MDAVAIHIGHHFFGTGNLGDDLMLAGFLENCRRHGFAPHLTCAVRLPQISSQRHRFPEITWLPYNRARREAAIQACDVWLGLGDTPFQSDCGPWMLNHLAEETDMCRRFGKPMFFLGVGVNNPEALELPQARCVLDYAEHIWTRDDASAALLKAKTRPGKVTSGADLAHLHLARLPWRPNTRKSFGFLLHFERPEQFTPKCLAAALEAGGAAERFWLVQEVRRLPFSERVLYELLPAALAQQVTLNAPDYDEATLGGLLDAWPSTETLVTSRYHGALVGAWRGARLMLVERNAKLAGAADQLQVTGRVTNFRDSETVRQAIAASRPVSRDRLHELASKAEQSCRSFVTALPKKRGQGRVQSWWQRLRRRSAA